MKKNLLIWILVVIFIITLIAPLAKCFRLTFNEEEYTEFDSQLSYSDIFYECDECKYPLYYIFAESYYDDNENIDLDSMRKFNKFMDMFKTLKFDSISPLKYALVRALAFTSNRYIMLQFDYWLTSEENETFDRQVKETVNASEKAYWVDVFKIFGKAYMFVSYDWSVDGDSKETVGAFVISESVELNELMSTKDYSGYGSVLQNPYSNYSFWTFIDIEMLIISICINSKKQKRIKTIEE